MKKLFLICLVFPLFSIGQDTYNLRKILEISAQAMDIKCKSLKYGLYNTTSYSEGYSKIETKILYDSISQINKLSTDITYYPSGTHDKKPDNRIIYYVDTTSQTAYQWNEKLSLLKIKLFESAWNYIDFFASTYNYFSYVKGELDFLLNPVFPDLGFGENSAYMERLIDSSLLCVGLVNIQVKPHYIVEHIMIYPSRSHNETYRYPDYKRDYYSPILSFNYYYIDTTTHIVNKVINFSLTGNNDTIFYNNVDLVGYSVNPFTDLTFNPNDYKTNKIIKETELTGDICDKGRYIVKELSGKLPNINGLDINDKEFSLYKQKAKCYILDFMYAKCGICIKSALPFWDEMSAKYNSRNIQYLIVDPVDDLRTVTYMAQQYNIKMPIIRDKEAQKKYAIDGYPTCYILDENFNILFSTTGEITPCERKEIEKILSSYQK